MNLIELNNTNSEERHRLLLTCCGSQRWGSSLNSKFPFNDLKALTESAERIWYNECFEQDWREAFSHHPKIGDVKSLAEKFASTKHLAEGEQGAVALADSSVISELAKANEQYEQKFGFIFIVCATGKSAEEMLALLNARIGNTLYEEMNVAMGEQHKITLIRLQKLLSAEAWNLKPGQVTTHVLDTSIGKPGKDIVIRLKRVYEGGWQTIAQGITNADGRIPDLLPPSRKIAAGNYKMVFDTGGYFRNNELQGFYPEVEIQFTITDSTHYHVPLLINPFGFSTYRGS